MMGPAITPERLLHIYLVLVGVTIIIPFLCMAALWPFLGSLMRYRAHYQPKERSVENEDGARGGERSSEASLRIGNSGRSLSHLRAVPCQDWTSSTLYLIMSTYFLRLFRVDIVLSMAVSTRLSPRQVASQTTSGGMSASLA